jgi:phenylacetate-CoA ligase
MQIAAQCGKGPHYHIHELDVLVEFLDDDGQPVPTGSPGNIVLTRLHAGPMPFIRYKVGDVGVRSGDSQCPCGRCFSLMESIQGRSADYVVTPSGNRLIVHFFTGILEHFSEIESFQVVQEEERSLRLRVVPRTGYGPDVEDKIRRQLIEKGADLAIEIETVKEIPLTSGGKRRFLIQKIEDRP